MSYLFVSGMVTQEWFCILKTGYPDIYRRETLLRLLRFLTLTLVTRFV
ncbi:hypothetical protein ANAPRD1_01092 [Anaplasma phagocytophilum]|nr:hypothetical protein [Anaplasma phagocytophilum]SCV64313.1 hypothetical protein ANAPH1_00574 [Anaplasma phagocytophilum]SCV66482.1 hypothetical protein ANAPRD1_01092 [Anaplasma phagocytophilum]